jgi:hypothetical protein
MCSADPKIFIRKPDGKRKFGRPRYKCENIQMYLNKIGGASTDWSNVARDKDCYCHANCNALSCSTVGWEFHEQLSNC